MNKTQTGTGAHSKTRLSTPDKNRIIQEIYEKLGEESREARAWGLMSVNDRTVLIRAAGMLGEKVHWRWDQLSAVDQQAIRDAARRAAEWVRKLEILPEAPTHEAMREAVAMLPKYVEAQRRGVVA